MSKKMMLFALAAISAAMFAVPAVASAGTPEVECGVMACWNFTIDGGESSLSTPSGFTVTCTGSSGNGSFSSKTGGSIELTFTGCKEGPFNTSCSNTATAGTITTTTLPFDNTYVGADNKTTPGILLTPAAGTGHYVTFKCASGAVTVEVRGNGVMGRLTTPPCSTSSTSLGLAFEITAHGQQKYKKITETGTEYDLTLNGTTAALKATGTITLASSGTVTCV